MSSNQEAKVLWEVTDADHHKYFGELPPIKAGTSLTDVETDLLREVTKLPNIIKAEVRVKWPNGSGCELEYRKSGEVWVRTVADHIPSNLFGVVMVVILIIGLASLVASLYL